MYAGCLIPLLSTLSETCRQNSLEPTHAWQRLEERTQLPGHSKSCKPCKGRSSPCQPPLCRRCKGNGANKPERIVSRNAHGSSQYTTKCLIRRNTRAIRDPGAKFCRPPQTSDLNQGSSTGLLSFLLLNLHAAVACCRFPPAAAALDLLLQRGLETVDGHSRQLSGTTRQQKRMLTSLRGCISGLACRFRAASIKQNAFSPQNAV